MNLTQLYYLVTAASYGSFTRAASVHHMTVPTISQSIRQLEEELDTVIFHRTKKGIAVTKEGEVILRHVSSVLKSLDVMKQELAQLKGERAEQFIISTIPGMVSQVVQATIEFAEQYPWLNVQMIEGDTQTVMQQVKDGYASMGFVSYSAKQQLDPALEWTPIIQGKAVLIASKGSALSVLRTVSAEDIKNEVFVLFNDEDIERIAQSLIAEHPSNRIALSTNNMEALYQMVVRGKAVTIGPDFIIRALPPDRQEQLVTIPLAKYQTEPVILGRITRIKDRTARLTEAFTARLAELCQGS